ncbi:MAG: hypothetical protein ACRDZO_06965 [Egibacteraceae bacterium]
MKFRKVLASTMLAALMALGSAPAAHAGGPRQDNDEATAIGGNGGNGGAAIGVGVCLIQIAVVGDAGCPNNGVADASGGNGGSAEALADIN